MESEELKSIEEKYIKLKKLRLEAVDNFEFIHLLILRLRVLVNSADSVEYDFEDLFSNIMLTVDDLYNYCMEYEKMLQKYN